MDGLHTQRVLRGERGHHRAAVDSQGREGLQVGLNARAAAAVGAGDGERDRAVTPRAGGLV